MENQLVCPNCNTTISNNPVIDAAVRKEAFGAKVITCECGEKMTFWEIMDRQRTQKPLNWEFQDWIQKTFKERG
ncbi:hypothetical protein ACFLYP_00975 [Chloroflexota bacterium]